MDLYNATIQATGNNISLVYQTAPFYMNIWFYIGVGAILIGLIFTAWAYFQYNIKNRTNFRIHMSDKKIITYSQRKFIGDVFKIKDGCKDKDGNLIEHHYDVVPECFEFGYFGRYLDYNHGVRKPINFSKLNMPDNFDLKAFSKVQESYLNSETLSMLLVIGKLKDLLISLLYFILGAVILGVIAIILVQLFNHPQAICTLANNNETISTIRIALGK